MPLPDIEVTKAATDGGPFVIKNLIPTLWMLGIAIAGGAVSFYQKVRSGKARAFNMTELLGEMVTSGLVGIVTFWICKAYGVNEYLTAACVAIAGHMGARAIFMVEQWIGNRFKS